MVKVLIESDWNLKDVRSAFYIMNSRINRIRLEFKEEYPDYQ